MIAKQSGGAGGRWRVFRPLAALFAAMALVAGALLVLPTPAARAAADSGLETWGPDSHPSDTHSFEETTPWAEVFNVSGGSVLVLQQDGELVYLNWEGTQPASGDIPDEVAHGGVRDAQYVSNIMAVAVTADGALHKWGETSGIVLANGVWTPEDLGGEATAVTAGIRSAVVTLDTGHVVEVSNFGITEVQRDGAPLTGVDQLGGRTLLEDGTVGRVVNGAWTTTIPADPADPVIDVSNTYAVTESGRILEIGDGTEVRFMPDLDPEVDGKPIRATGVGGTALLLTDKGKLDAWVPSSGGEPADENLQIPDVVANGTVRELIDGSGFAVWMGEEPPVTVGDPSRITGSARVGSQLTGAPATFAGVPDSTSVEWRDAGTDQVLGTETTYTPTSEDLGRSIVFVTIARKAGQDDVVSVSDPIGPVEAAAVSSTTSVAVTKGTYGKAAKATVTVDAGDADATGSVRVTVDGKSAGAANLSAGKATVTLPKTLKPGKHTVRASYAGSDAVEASTGTATMQVAKGATGKPKVKVAKKPTRKKAGLAKVAVPTAKGLVKAAGKVVVTLKKGKQTKKVKAAVKKGVAKVKLPKLAKGKWAVVARYNGNAYYKPISSKKVVLKVR